MNLAISIDASDPTPPFEQIRRTIAAACDAGALAPGTRMPPVRQLAADMGVAAGTVARAYKELEAAGYVVTHRGAGTRVAPRDVTAADRTRRLDAWALEAVSAARALGADDSAIREAFARALAGRTPGG